MKLLSWNCNGAFRKKIDLVKDLDVDLAVILECEKYINWSDEGLHQWIWKGERISKGVGIFSFNPNLNLSEVDLPFTNNRWFIPVQASNGTRIMAVWAMNHRDNQVIDNIQPTFRTITENRDAFSSADLIIGDFNNNVIWDDGPSKKYTKGSFGEIVSELSTMGFESLYHNQTGESFGHEKAATLFLQRNKNKPYHVDYAFARTEESPVKSFEILTDSKYLQLSDHRPLLIETHS